MTQERVERSVREWEAAYDILMQRESEAQAAAQAFAKALKQIADVAPSWPRLLARGILEMHPGWLPSEEA